MNANQEKKQEAVRNEAAMEGMKAFLSCGLVSSAMVLAANKYSPTFRKYFNISGKVALGITPPVFCFSLRSEQSVISAIRNPDQVKSLSGEIPKHSSLLLHHKVANYAYEHPFQLVLGLAIPSYGTLFYLTNKGEHLAFSQKVMHTRVYGQGLVISILLGTMLFRDYMEKRGGCFKTEN